MSEDEFAWVVRDNAGRECGRRRTMADAIALVRMLMAASPKRGPYSYTGPTG